MGPDQENRVGDLDNGSSGRPVSSGLQVPGEHRDIVVRKQRHRICYNTLLNFRRRKYFFLILAHPLNKM